VTNAVYADLTVTDDGPFVETCKISPSEIFALEGFEDFVGTRLGISRK